MYQRESQYHGYMKEVLFLGFKDMKNTHGVKIKG